MRFPLGHRARATQAEHGQEAPGHALTRRGFIGAAGTAAAAVTLLAGCTHKKDEEADDPVVIEGKDSSQIKYVIDPETNKNIYKAVDFPFGEGVSYTIALGNVLHQGEGSWLPATTAGSSANPMVKGSAFSIHDGTIHEVITETVAENAPNTVIYDVRCSDSAYAWVELNLLNKHWVLYAAPFADGALTGESSTLWKGNADYDPPRFAVTGNKVIWLVMPSASGSKTAESSYCYLWKTGSSDAKAVVESPGRFATPPAVSGNTVTLVPRVKASEGTFYGITAYSLKNDLKTKIDQLVLPQSVRPLRAVRLGDVFAFSIEASYDSGGALGKMGTYIGPSDGPFVALSREPAAEVSGKEGLYFIKSRASYFVVNTEDKTYSVLLAANRSVDYGEYPARDGSCETFVSFATVKNADTGYPDSVTVRAFGLG